MTNNSERILARNITVSNNTRFTGINNNDLIVGPSGAGKTRGYVIPNILRTNENMIIADTKGNLCRQYGTYLEKRGYKVMSINFADIRKSSWGYNPLSFVRKSTSESDIAKGCGYIEQDIKKISRAMCPIQNKDPFWDLAAQMYLECYISYVLNFLPKNEHNLCTVYELLTLAGSDEFISIMNEACDMYPQSSCARQYKMIQQNRTAEKMDASIKGILARHLDVLSYSDTARLFTMNKQIDMSEFTKRPAVLFITVSDSDRSQDTLVNLFYTQALQYLMFFADNQPDSRLPIPVRFILDDFSTNTVIPDFDNIISVIRSREISVSLIIQSISQLEGLYGESKAQTIINNCDNCLYLGGQDVRTAEYFSEKMNKTVSTVLSMSLDSMYLFTRGREPVKADKYNLNEDKVYRILSETEPCNNISKEDDFCDK